MAKPQPYRRRIEKTNTVYEVPEQINYLFVQWRDWIRLEGFVKRLISKKSAWNPRTHEFWLAFCSMGMTFLVSAFFAWLQAFISCVDQIGGGFSACWAGGGNWLYLCFLILGIAMIVIGNIVSYALKGQRQQDTELTLNEMTAMCEGQTRPDKITEPSSEV